MPCECGLTIEQIAAKDVPYGVPYLILEDGDLPSDWSFSAAWEADFSSHHGIGLGPQRYFIRGAEQRLAEIAARVAPSDVIPQDKPEDMSAEDYAAYVAAVADGNVRQRDAFDAQCARDTTDARHLIAQMQAEIVQLEGAAA